MADPVSQLEREWPALARGALARRYPRWCVAQPELLRFAGPEALLAFLRRAARAEADAPLLALLELAAVDRDAARLCLQAFLPALKAQARGRARGADRDEVWALLLARAWEAIRTYPLARRRRVAANVVLQVLHDSTRDLERHRCARHGTAGAEAARPSRGHPAGAEGLVAAAVAAGRLDPGDGELVLASRVDGVPLPELAAGLGAGYDALRKRRQRAERALARFLAERGAVPNRGPSVLNRGEGAGQPDGAPPNSPLAAAAVGAPGPSRGGSRPPRATSAKGAQP